MTRQSPPTPYELLHRIAERRGAKVLLYSDGAKGRVGSVLRDVGWSLESKLGMLTVDMPNDDVPLAMSSLDGRTLDEAALSCLRQLKVRV